MIGTAPILNSRLYVLVDRMLFASCPSGAHYARIRGSVKDVVNDALADDDVDAS